MSIVERAKIELAAINFGEEDSAVMVEILEKFFSQWDSGGAVSVAGPVLARLIAGQPLSPLTGDDSEWHDPMGDGRMLQNVRYGSVFKYMDSPDKAVIDVDTDQTVTFPYDPPTRMVSAPVLEVTERV